MRRNYLRDTIMGPLLCIFILIGLVTLILHVAKRDNQPPEPVETEPRYELNTAFSYQDMEDYRGKQHDMKDRWDTVIENDMVVATIHNTVSYIRKSGFELLYSETHGCPLVVWYTSRDSLVDMYYSRKSFRADPDADPDVVPSLYTHSGYDRGHMAPARAMSLFFGKEAHSDSYYMSNICPQDPSLNRGLWRRIEADVVDKHHAQTDRVMVLSGPIFRAEYNKLGGKVSIPSDFYKIVAEDLGGSPVLRALIIPNTAPPKKTTPAPFQRSVNDVEALTGLDFFVGLVNEESLESLTNSWVRRN